MHVPLLACPKCFIYDLSACNKTSAAGHALGALINPLENVLTSIYMFSNRFRVCLVVWLRVLFK